LSGNAPFDLTCEYLTNPLGLDENRPRLAWKSRCANQSAYEVHVSSAPGGKPDLWNSGIVRSDASIHIPYAGAPLAPIQRAHWRVRVWDEGGKPGPWSAEAFWEAGLPLPHHWTGAKWIGCPSVSLASNGPPAVYLRRRFEVGGQIARARLFLSAKGLFVAELNGERVGDSELAPGWTDYNRRIPYEAYDVAGMLNQGSNVLDVVLGDGWYCGNVCWFGRRQYGPYPQLLAKLYIEFEDAEPLRIVSDESWLAGTGRIRQNDLLMGQTLDARIAEPEFGQKVLAAPMGHVPVVSRRCEPVRTVEVVQPVKCWRMGSIWLADFGQNLVGRPRLRAKGERGRKVRLRHAEMLDAKGALYAANLRSARQEDVLVLSGGHDDFEPEFTFHGFRYVEVRGLAREPEVEAFVLTSAQHPSGRFRCGHAMLDKLALNIQRGMKGNYLEVPTDCPQRDERLGWTGDAQIFAPTAAYNFSIAAFMTKWLQDVRDAQSDDGAFPNVAPQMLQLGDGAPAWADAGVIVPWTLYRFYGDLRILEESFPSIVRYLGMIEGANPDGLWRNMVSHNFGDWLNVDADTPKDVLATAFFAHSAGLASKMAGLLGRLDDGGKLRSLAARIRSAFRTEFVSPDGRICGDTQTSYALALRFDLLTKAQAAKAGRLLAADIEAKGHLTTGFLGVGHLLPALSQIGRDDLALRLLLSEEYPSWGYSIRHGATTIWERWDGWTEEKGFQDPGMNSFNHYALGSCGEWMFSRLGGIQLDPETPAFKRFFLDPLFSREIGWAECSYESPYGKIVSEWRFEGSKLRWSAEVPPNTSAEAVFDGKRHGLGPGRHEFEARV
jgi:alpha-L-rhamnosidase